MQDYLLNHLAPQTAASLANETWYLFGDTLSDEWRRLQSLYTLPLDAATDDPVVAVGVGGRFSGVSFHTHGPGFSESVTGAKRWFLYPPDVRPDFRPDESQLQWSMFRQHAQSQPPLECTVAAGEAIYFPSMWWHATLNVADYNVFASVFTHEASDAANL